MKSLSELELQVLSRIKPRREEYELVKEACGKVISVVESVAREKGVEVEVTIQGSIAHDTWLSGDRDVDIFVLFPGDWSKEDLVKKGFEVLLEAASRIGHYELRYAEHPYVRVEVSGVEVDLVPGLKLREPTAAKTAVDRTPFHTLYLSKVLTDELRDHVRLLKKFMKTIGVYGAEVKTHGFSGYAAELLVVVYGGFREVLEAASRWKPPVLVNTLGDKLSESLVKALKSKYPDSCIYMPDPVDPLRNVTASVSLKSLATLVVASKCYLKAPNMAFFEEPKEPSVEELLRALAGRCIVVLEYELREKLPPDVVWGEIQRVASRLVKVLEVLGIRVLDYSSWTNEKDLGVIAVELEQCSLWRYKHYRGPCIVHEDDRIASFIRKHAGRGLGPWITRDGCLEALDVREETDVTRLIESRWVEYTVAPHLKLTKPTVEVAGEDLVLRLLSKGAGKWLREFVFKASTWMEKCTI